MIEIKIDKKHIIFKLLGLKLKVKLPPDYLLMHKFYKHKVDENTILIIELNPCHNETVVGYCHYLKQLGYNVEILVNKLSETDFLNIDGVKIWEFLYEDILRLFKNANFTKYERIIFNSKIIYKTEAIDIVDVCKKLPTGQQPNLYVQHHLEKINEDILNQIILANPNNIKEWENNIVNPHYFVENIEHKKNNITEFVVVGEISRKRKNFDLLLKAVEELLEKNVDNFQVKVIGHADSAKIPEKLSANIKILGRLSFQQMYDEVLNSDFILPLLDKNIVELERYITQGTSGSFQLSYGFAKPCVIQKCFAEKYALNNENAIIYNENEEFSSKLLQAIELSNSEYQNICKSLKCTSLMIQEKSLKNLKRLLDENFIEVSNG